MSLLIKKSLLLFLFLLLNSYSRAQSEQRIRFTSVTASLNTGQDYTPWFSDDVNNLVQNVWQNNSRYVDVTLKLPYHATITRLSLYDFEGIFTTNPAYIYALNGTKKTLIGIFTGPNYLVFDDMKPAKPLQADAIVIHKYGNNIPQKVFIYGYPFVIPPPKPIVPVVPAPVVPQPVLPLPVVPIVPPIIATTVKIPIDSKRWYQLNNVSNGLDGLFDGITNVNVSTGWGKVLNEYDAYYPVAPGELISLNKIKLFSYEGDQKASPLTIFAINGKGQKIQLATFVGGQYNTWVGPYPGINLTGDAQFNLDSTVNDIKYLVMHCSYQFPTEIEFYGTYTAGAAVTPVVNKAYPLKNYFGVNSFEWNFENPANPLIIDTTRLRAAKTFTQIRHYLDWGKLETQQGSYSFNPVHDGGWNYDAMYQSCKDAGIEVLADIKTLPGWMVATYPNNLKNSENVPMVYGSDPLNPNSYIEQARVAFQFAARYGSASNVNSALLSVNNTPRWTNDPVNTVKQGMGLIRYIECDNERDKWWFGRSAYQTSYEYAANLSAFYDGNKNTMGPGIGIKNADPNMKVVMGGLASASTDYLRGMIDWCKQNRGYNADGTVNLCWDVMNYHMYANDAQNSQSGNSTRGAAPEISGVLQTAQDFVQTAHQYAADMPVWVTETGYDVNQGSPLKAIPIGNKTVLQTQADWILRTSLLYARSGIERAFFYEMYDDNLQNPTKFASSGLINADMTRKPAADYLYQTNKLMGNYTYKQTLNNNPIVDRYELNSQPAFVLVVPDEIGRTATYVLDLAGADSARIYTPTIGTDNMQLQTVKTDSGKLTLNVTETPSFVIPVYAHTGITATVGVLSADKETIVQLKKSEFKNTVDGPAGGEAFSVYPNPAIGYTTISSGNLSSLPIDIVVSAANTGIIYKKYHFNPNGTTFSTTINLSSLPMGACIIQFKQGNEVTTRKVMKLQ